MLSAMTASQVKRGGGSAVTTPEALKMSQRVAIELEVPEDLARFRLPPGVDARLRELLDRQDGGIPAAGST